MKTKLLLLVPICCVLERACFGQFTTWIKSGSTNISSNQVMQIVSTKLSSGASTHILTITKGTNSTFLTAADFKYTATQGASWPWPITISGPATVSLSLQTAGGDGFVTFKVFDNVSENTPSTAVVIPTDATGPVNIILESSADLVNWTAALPGTYGTSTTNRFFRVRAVRQ